MPQPTLQQCDGDTGLQRADAEREAQAARAGTATGNTGEVHKSPHDAPSRRPAHRPQPVTRRRWVALQFGQRKFVRDHLHEHGWDGNFPHRPAPTLERDKGDERSFDLERAWRQSQHLSVGALRPVGVVLCWFATLLGLFGGDGSRPGSLGIVNDDRLDVVCPQLPGGSQPIFAL